jgi:hypothetical protein
MRNDFDSLIKTNRASSKTAKILRRKNRRTLKTELKSFDGNDYTGQQKVETKFWFDDSPRLDIPKYLERFLESRIGKNWDDVYSEITQVLKVKNKVHRYILNCIDFLVHKKTTLINNKVYVYLNYYPNNEPVPISTCRGDFYIYPTTKTLEKCPFTRFRFTHTTYNNHLRYIDLDNKYVQYHKIYGVWYKITLRNFDKMYDVEPNKILMDIVYSNIKARYKKDCLREFVFGGQYTAIAKEQISGKELKRIKDLCENRGEN